MAAVLDTATARVKVVDPYPSTEHLALAEAINDLREAVVTGAPTEWGAARAVAAYDALANRQARRIGGAP